MKKTIIETSQNNHDKRGIAHYKQFLLLSKCFQEEFVSETFESFCTREMVNHFPHTTILQQKNLIIFYQKNRKSL